MPKLLHYKTRGRDIRMIRGFPKHLLDDANYVKQLISTRTSTSSGAPTSENRCSYLVKGDSISFPYRVYYQDVFEKEVGRFSPIQQLIYHCIFSRHHNGFTRQKHIDAILLLDEIPYWIFPYILKVCDEYVVEILESVYTNLYERNNDDLKIFCHENIELFCLSYARMVSYWNEFYRCRNGSYPYKTYIGKKLFHDCFGYSCSMNKLLTTSKTNTLHDV